MFTPKPIVTRTAPPVQSAPVVLLAPDPVGIPADMQAARRWVVWRSESGKEDKSTKTPYIAAAGPPRRASSTNTQTWRSLDDAYAVYLASQATMAPAPPYDGIGFVLGDGFIGGDFDGCRDPETGHIAGWARRYLEALLEIGAYVDLSPTESGFKFVATGTWPHAWHKRLLPETPLGGKYHAAVEVYGDSRYFTITGATLGEGPSRIVDAQQVLDALARDFTPPDRTVATPRALPDLQALGAALPDDQAVIDRAHDAANGVKFAALWRGDISVCGGDHSAADLALCSLLAFWTGPDAARIDRLFRQSGIYREKWDTRHRADGATYGAMTIARALERAEYYDPARGQQTTRADRDTAQLAKETAPDAAPIAQPRRVYLTGPTPFAAALREAGWGALAIRTYDAICTEFGVTMGEPYSNGQPAARVVYGKNIAKTTEDTPNRTNAALDALTRGHFVSRVQQCERDADGHIRRTWYLYQLPNAPAWEAWCGDPTLFEAPGPLRTSLADKARYAERKAQRLVLTMAREALDTAVQNLNARPHDDVAIAAQKAAWADYAVAKAAAVPRKAGRPRAATGQEVQSTPTMACHTLKNRKGLQKSDIPENRSGFSGEDAPQPEWTADVAAPALVDTLFGFPGDTGTPPTRKLHPLESLVKRTAHRVPMPAPMAGSSP